MNDHFDKSEAQVLVGRRFRTKVDFSGVPKGTTGVVIKADEASPGWLLRIRWELLDRSWPLDDWFTKSEVERYLEEVRCG